LWGSGSFEAWGEGWRGREEERKRGGREGEGRERGREEEDETISLHER
jgi:hypothetical protein